MDSMLRRLQDFVIDPETPPEAVTQVFAHAPRMLLQDLAVNPLTPARILDRLLTIGADETRIDLYESIMSNPNVPVYIVESLSWHERPHIRSLVARCARTPVAILERLVFDDDPSVRHSLVRNQGLPPQILERLRTDPSRWVRAEVEHLRMSRLNLTPPY